MNRPFLALLGALLLLLVCQPFLVLTGWGRPLLDLLFSGVLVSCLAVSAEQRVTLRTGLVLGVPAILARWAVYADPTDFSLIASFATNIGFMGFTACAMLWIVSRERDVSIDTISGGVCVYLLIAVVFALMFGALELLQSGSFAGAITNEIADQPPAFPVDGGINRLLYFSFVTITTLGYGDILPVTPAARMLCSAEAILGQIYLTIFVARLVGLHIAAAQRN